MLEMVPTVHSPRAKGLSESHWCLAVDEADWELMEGMVNCYATCREDFENTVRMVAAARGLRRSDVKKRIIRIRKEVGETAEFMALRTQLPEEFPF